MRSCFASLAGLVALFLAACSTQPVATASPTGLTDGGGASSATVSGGACSNGPPRTEIGYEPDAAKFDGAPECVPRCGDDRKATWGRAVSALPSGACSIEGERCTMAAMYFTDCPDGTTVYYSYSGFGCTCDGGTWDCDLLHKGASIGFCPDAGVAESAPEGT